MRRLATRLALVLATLTVLPAAPALAQEAGRLTTGGMDLRLFRPAMDSKGYLSLNGTDVLGHLDFSFGLVVDGGFGLLPYSGFVNDSGTGRDDAARCGLFCGRALDYLFTGTLHANLGLANLLEVGLQIPLGFSAGPNLTIPRAIEGGTGRLLSTGYNEYLDTGGSIGGAGAAYQGFAGLIIHSKLRILRAERNSGFGLAVGLQLEFPTGDSRRFVGDNTFGLWPMVFAEYRANRYVRFGLNVGARLMFGDGPTIPVGGRSVIDPSVGNAECGIATMGPRMGMAACANEGGSPVRYGPYLTYGLGAGFRLGDSPIELTLEVYGGSIFESFASTGGTSLEAMGGVKIFVDRNSYLVLAGGGGLPVSGLLQSDVRAMLGFIFEPSIGDRDGDGYRDDTDECPDEPEDFDDFADEDGCPDPDNDRDGILDTDDLCPNDPEDRDGWQDDDGCPDPDNDADRILDGDDSCINDPETYNGTEDEDGCPDRGTVIVTEEGIIILERILFETDSAEILPQSFPIIDAVAATMVGNPQITLVEVQGHADERSSDEYNIRLTSDRAAAVVEALVSRGVSRSRLRSAGYGERCPIDPRSTAAAWDQNRRVEFKIIMTSDGPTGVEVACPAGRDLIPR